MVSSWLVVAVEAVSSLAMLSTTDAMDSSRLGFSLRGGMFNESTNDAALF